MKRRGKSEEAENPFWITYSDLLSSMVLLLLILLVVFIKISEAQRLRLENEKRKSEKLAESLKTKTSELQKKQGRLRNLQAELRKLRDNLKKYRHLLIDLQDNDLTLSVDQTLLFDEDSDQLKPAGKAFLDKFIPPLAATITNKDYKDLIQGIIFEGRADPSFHSSNWDEAYQHNLGVTLDRSKSVVSYIFGGQFKVKFPEDKQTWPLARERLRYLVLSSGRSSVDRVKVAIPEADSLRKDWRRMKLWKLKEGQSRQVVIRLELYNPLSDFEFEDPK